MDFSFLQRVGGGTEYRGVSLMLALLSALLLATPSLGYILSGDSVIFNSTYASMTVTPHTAYSPTSEFKQNFRIESNVAQSGDLYVAYCFNEPLRKGKVELPVTQLKTITLNQTCQGNLSLSNGLANCSYVSNGTTSSFSFPAEWVSGSVAFWNYSFNETSMVDVSNKFAPLSYNGQKCYYSTTPLNFKGYESKNWDIEYTPAVNDTSKKWDMYLWSGASANCILAGTCAFNYHLDPWWNTTFLYRKNISVTENTCSGDLTNFQVYTNLSYASPMKSNFSDMRFVWLNGSTEQEIDFWLEDKVNSDWASFWFEMPKLANCSKQTVYAYYGSSASSASNGENTFIFFDDFDDASYDTAKWTTYAGSPSEASGYLQLTGTTKVYSDVDLGSSTIRMRSYKNQVRIMGVQPAGASTDQNIESFEDNPVRQGVISAQGGGQSTTPSTIPDASWNTYAIKWSSGSSAEFSIDDSVVATHTTNVYTSSTARVYFYTYLGDTELLRVDWVLSRKYVSTEPTVSVSGQESETYTVPSSNSPIEFGSQLLNISTFFYHNNGSEITNGTCTNDWNGQTNSMPYVSGGGYSFTNNSTDNSTILSSSVNITCSLSGSATAINSSTITIHDTTLKVVSTSADNPVASVRDDCFALSESISLRASFVEYNNIDYTNATIFSTGASANGTLVSSNNALWVYNYTLSNPGSVGAYNYRVVANDTYSNSNSSTGTFYVEALPSDCSLTGGIAGGGGGMSVVEVVNAPANLSVFPKSVLWNSIRWTPSQDVSIVKLTGGSASSELSIDCKGALCESLSFELCDLSGVCGSSLLLENGEVGKLFVSHDLVAGDLGDNGSYAVLTVVDQNGEDTAINVVASRWFLWNLGQRWMVNTLGLSEKMAADMLVMVFLLLAFGATRAVVFV